MKKIENNLMQREAGDLDKYPFMLSQRCNAKTRRHTSCQSPAVRGKRRCRMHGGGKGSGAPLGSQNALKHGHTTKRVLTLRREIKIMLKEGSVLRLELGKRYIE